MKNAAFLILILGTALLGETWSKVRIDLSSAPSAQVMAGLDVVNVKPGVWAEAVATKQDLDILNASGIKYQVLVPDLESYYATTMSASSPFGNYYCYHEAVAILDSLHERFPDIISEKIALPNDTNDLTWDSNYVWAVKISDNVGTQEEEPEVLYTGLHHAREPIGVHICIEWARWLCENYGKDPLATYLVDNRQIWIVPMTNPDGYLINEANNPAGGGLYRKNARPVSSQNPGVDLNRNYPYMWGYDNEGSSSNPLSDTYRGPNPGSEPEVQSIMNLCKAHNFILALNFHSYSNLFLYPWSYVDLACNDSFPFYSWGEEATRTGSWSDIQSRTVYYNVITGYLLYNTNGDSDDWMYGETETKNRILSVTPEVGEDFWQEYAIEEQIAETHPFLLATAKAAAVFPELESVSWSDGGDGVISPGESIELTVKILNLSVKDSSGTIALALEGEDSRITLDKATAEIPSLALRNEGSNASDPLKLTISNSAKSDSAIPLTLKITADGQEFIHNLIIPVGKRDSLIKENFDDKLYPGWNSNWSFTTTSKHSGKYSITDSPQGDYGSPAFYYLESPKLNLQDRVSPDLSFWHHYELEKGFDWAALQVKNADLADWVTLKHWSGTENNWLEERFDLSDYVGSTDFQIRFILTADSGVEADGWYVDDIALTSFKGKVTTGIHELAEIRPAPVAPLETITKGVLHFEGPKGTALRVELFDASGRKIAQTKGFAPMTWDLSTSGDIVSAGVYFIHTITSTGETNKKVVVVN